MPLSSDQIGELLQPFVVGLNPTKLALVEKHLDLLLKWNAKMNLTAVRQPEEIVTRHFGESFLAARNLFAEKLPATVADLGSGAGFPGVPLKIWNSQAQVTLIESNQKKATFLRELVRTLSLADVTVESARAETLELQADIVTLRAVEQFRHILPIALQLVGPKGRLALLIGTGQIGEAQSTLPSLSWSEPTVIPLSSNRCLLVGTA